MSKTNVKNIRVSLMLPLDTVKWLEIISRRCGVPRSAIVSIMLDQRRQSGIDNAEVNPVTTTVA